FNRRHKKVGHLFQGRYKAILVERDSYLLELARYLVLNPVRAKIVTSPQRYPWSSYRAMLGTAPVPAALTIEWVLDQFGGSKATARKRYGEFVEEGIGQSSPWKALKSQALLGSEKFVKRLIPQLQEQASSREIPKRQRLLHRPPLSKLLAGMKTKAARNKALAGAYRDYDYTLAEIGRETGLHYASVSRIIKTVEDEMS
ncbi:MAG: addiction module toxin RelE, partial [Gammaproteobacteria bacterium]